MFMQYDMHQINHQSLHKSIMALLPAAGAIGDLREGALEEDVLLVIHNVHSSPVHRNDHLVLGQRGARESIRLIET